MHIWYHYSPNRRCEHSFVFRFTHKNKSSVNIQNIVKNNCIVIVPVVFNITIHYHYRKTIVPIALNPERAHGVHRTLTILDRDQNIIGTRNTSSAKALDLRHTRVIFTNSFGAKYLNIFVKHPTGSSDKFRIAAALTAQMCSRKLIKSFEA